MTVNGEYSKLRGSGTRDPKANSAECEKKPANSHAQQFFKLHKTNFPIIFKIKITTTQN